LWDETHSYFGDKIIVPVNRNFAQFYVKNLSKITANHKILFVYESLISNIGFNLYLRRLAVLNSIQHPWLKL